MQITPQNRKYLNPSTEEFNNFFALKFYVAKIVILLLYDTILANAETNNHIVTIIKTFLKFKIKTDFKLALHNILKELNPLIIYINYNKYILGVHNINLF